MNSYTTKDVQRLLKVKATAKSKGELKEVASCCNVLGEIFQQQGKYEDAVSQHEEERVVCKQLNDTIGIGIAHRKVGEALNELGQYENALKHQQKYLALAKSVDNRLEIQRALATIGRTHFCHAEALTTNNRVLYDKALASSKHSYQKSLELCERLKGAVSEKEYMQMTARLLLNLALVCDLQQQDNAAVNYFKKAIYIAEKYTFREDLHRCHYSLALFFQRRKNYSQAKRETEMAERVAFQLKDKALICDDLALKAQLFVIMADFESARRYLLKAFKQKTPVAQDSERIEKDLRSAIQLCKLQDMCCALQPDEEEKLIRLHEKMGDLCSSLKAYPRAIDFYLKMLNKAQELGWPAKDVNPIYVSLSQTYMDEKDYKNAILYYKKELEQYDNNPSESCRTILNIANALEEDGATYYELEPLYQQALNFAIKAENPRLKATTLNSLAVLQEMNGFLEKSQQAMAEVSQICAEHNIDLDDDSETLASQTTRDDHLDEEEHIDLAEFIDEDSDEETLDTSRTKRRTKKNIEKLNVKGETALHRACIKQDITLVRQLLQQKHKVNVRDNCGWTPLHEACNYGDVEIVELLIEHGAAINDRGGKHCDGVTPLHDAASCGHIDVMDVLLRHGANPLSQTDGGESVYECLLKWRLRTGGDLDPRLLKECTSMEQKLVELMKRANQAVPSVREIEHKQSSTSALIPEEEIVGSSLQEDDLLPVDLSDTETDNFKFKVSKPKRQLSSSAQREYAQAMEVIGSSSVRRSTLPTLSSKRTRTQPALILEEEVEEDWLENDLPSPTRKTGKKSHLSFPVHKPSCQTDKQKTSLSTTTSTSSRSNKAFSKLSLNHRRRSDSSPVSHPETVVSDDDFDVEEIPPLAKRSKPSPSIVNSSDDSNGRASPVLSVSKRPKKPIQLSMLDFAESFGAPSEKQIPKKPGNNLLSPSSAQQASPSVLKLYIRINDKVLLIPVERNKSVKWLSDEAARRYYNMTGLNPVLSLQTMDGAVLNGEDVVALILQDGDKIVGEMVKWDLQPLPERYANLCRQLEIVRLADVDTLLTNAHTSGKLAFDLPLGSYILPAIKALRYQESLWDLDLSATKLDDQLFQSLSEALGTLSHLVNLNLQSNLITAAGLTRLAESLQAENTTGLKKLQQLNLSFNPLGDGASYPLANCLNHMTALRGLLVESCDLTDRFWDANISSVLKRKGLEQIGIGFNDFTPGVIKSSIEALDFSTLKLISLKALPSDRLVTYLCNSIQAVEESQLTEVDLSHCHLKDACISQLSLVLNHTPYLRRLVLKNNIGLSIGVVADLISSCRMKGVRIEELDLLGCSLAQSSTDDIDRCAESLRSFLTWSKSLIRLSLSFNRQCDYTSISLMSEAWKSGHCNGVARQPTEHQLILSTLN